VRRLLAVGVVLAGLAPAPAHALDAGAASVDITPPVGTPMFAYTARSAVASPDKLPSLVEQMLADPSTGNYAKTFVSSKGIHTRVRARALVLRTTRGPFALVQADLGGIPQLLTNAVLGQIAATGITADRLVLSATHTHSSTGPIWPSDSLGYALLGGDLYDPRIFVLTANGIAQAIRTASERLGPARAGIGVTELTGASRNRNFEPFKRNADVPRDPAAARKVQVDPTVTVLRVERPDGTPVAAWSNFAIHPTSFGDDNLLFSGDNAATAERVAEGRIGAPVVWTNSAEGDVSPDGDPTEREYAPNAFAAANLAGTRVGRAVVRAWKAAKTGALELDSRYTLIRFEGLAALGAGGVVAPDGTCSPVPDLAGPGQGSKLPLLAAPGIAPATVPVSTWRLGDTVLVALPVEMTTQMGRRVRAAVQAATGAEHVVIAGLSNSYMSYTATPEEYDACHYEGSFTLYGRDQGARLRDASVTLARALVTGAEAPAPAVRFPPILGLPGGGGSPPRESPDAGKPSRQPADRVPRMGVATFAWHGGDPQVDAPRGKTFVATQHRGKDSWTTVATDDGVQDTVTRTEGDVWTQRFQVGVCDPLGDYRFVVTGRSARGPYTVTSRPFRVEALRLRATLAKRRVTATYPDPGKDVLTWLPRAVTRGTSVLRVGGRRMRARLGRTVPKHARLLGVRDGCGNVG
jgi:neutral ceramidase